MDFVHLAVAFGAAFLAGVINSLAGGGTLLTFPTLVWLGLNSITANATSTVALCAFAVGGAYGYRKEIAHVERSMWYVGIPGLFGGLAGAILLRMTPSSVFDKLVPYLILFATILFMAQEPVQRLLKTSNPEAHKSQSWLIGAGVFQLFVGIYGGYFGAGIGILMLAALSILGMQDIHQMNGLKSVFAGALNVVAALYFIQQKMVYWPDVGIMAFASIIGGFVGAGAARKIGRAAVRKVVILVGFGMAISLFIKH
jgi:uncharacterized protein